MSTVGRVASIDFLWEAVLESVQPDRRRALAILVEFGRIDDELVDVVIGPPWTAGTLVEGLPLIETAMPPTASTTCGAQRWLVRRRAPISTTR